MSTPVSLNPTLQVNEVFGRTIQGEGPFAGRLCAFVRLTGCDLDCTFCDTPFTWDWDRYDPAKETHPWTVDTIVAAVAQMRVPLVVISGGEPMIQRAGLVALCKALIAAGHAVQIETNGRHAPPEGLPPVHIVASPKLANSGVSYVKAIRYDKLAALAAAGAWFKFVAVDTGCITEAAEIVEVAGIDPARVWIMPEGVDIADIDARHQVLAEAAIAAGFNYTTRLHVAIWGQKRGV